MNKIRPVFNALSMYSRRHCNNFNRLIVPKNCYCSRKTNTTSEEIDNEPIQYSKSPASQWRAEFSRTGQSESRLWYEPYVILGSIAIFMIYFTILREENDVDLDLGRSLYSHIEGLEEHQLRMSLEYNIQNGLETESIVKRLKEIQKQKEND